LRYFTTSYLISLHFEFVSLAIKAHENKRESSEAGGAFLRFTAKREIRRATPIKLQFVLKKKE
jgi:hypothetical protein